MACRPRPRRSPQSAAIRKLFYILIRVSSYFTINVPEMTIIIVRYHWHSRIVLEAIGGKWYGCALRFLFPTYPLASIAGCPADPSSAVSSMLRFTVELCRLPLFAPVLPVSSSPLVLAFDFPALLRASFHAMCPAAGGSRSGRFVSHCLAPLLSWGPGSRAAGGVGWHYK